MKNLKSCPCCGGAAHLITRPQIGVLSGDDGFLSTIKCIGGSDCGLQVSAWALKKTWAIESVTKKWNRRVNEVLPEQHTRLNDMNDQEKEQYLLELISDPAFSFSEDPLYSMLHLQCIAAERSKHETND